MIPNDIIRIKRNKKEIPSDDLKQFIWEYSHEQISDKDMTKLLKAIFKNGMSRKEIFALTQSMIDSGDKMDFSFLSNYVADKHSTGGVGDKVSIILGPLMAAAGLSIPMISGRSLGHTGGTLDKLETIPGYKTNISLDQFRRNVNDIGISMIGQTEEICPADRNRVTPLVGMWTPNVLLLITGIYLTLNTVRDRASFNWPWKKKAKDQSNDSK